jgi:hypothetical protein
MSYYYVINIVRPLAQNKALQELAAAEGIIHILRNTLHNINWHYFILLRNQYITTALVQNKAVHELAAAKGVIHILCNTLCNINWYYVILLRNQHIMTAGAVHCPAGVGRGRRGNTYLTYILRNINWNYVIYFYVINMLRPLAQYTALQGLAAAEGVIHILRYILRNLSAADLTFKRESVVRNW